MPPAKRTTAAAAKKAEAAVEAAVEHVADICRTCWPHGWPHLSHSASCEHGTYVREPAAEPEKAPENPPADDTEKTEDAPPAGEKTGA